MIPDSEITDCPEQEVKSKIRNIFVNKKHIWDPYFNEHYKKNTT